MLEPQSTALFILLMAAFCGLLAWVALTKQTVFRVLAASLAFIPAMLFGVAAVNKYYNYYQTWGSISADLGAQGGANNLPSVSGYLPSKNVNAILSKVTQAATASKQGETVQFTITGPLSHITRQVLIYLPPQYFQSGYRNYRFPAIELMPGFPGEPLDWINVVGITQTYLTLLGDGLAKPAVLVMPDTNPNRQTSLQCLNVVHGPQDATFLSVEVPQYFAQTLRVQPPGPAWGVAGYSEGGYCAANLALVYRLRYGFAAVLSGYFRPDRDKLGHPPHRINPFGRNRRLAQENTPLDRVRALPVDAVIPQFWLGAGNLDVKDVVDARTFQELLLPRQPGVQLQLAPGGGHTMTTWRALIPPMLEWMTPGLAQAASGALPGMQHRPAPHASPAPTPSSPALRTGSATPSRAARRVPTRTPSP